jgi:hypothetical protein
MAFVADTYLDLALEGMHTAGVRLDLCSQEPTSYTAATTTYTLGRKTSLVVGAPENGATSGRRIIVPAITDGSNAANGTATHWALTDGSSTLIATGSLSVNKTMVSGDPWTSTAFSITLPDAVSE